MSTAVAYVTVTVISFFVKHTHLALEAFDQVTNGHTGGDGVRVDDDIRRDPFTCERHVLGRRRGVNDQVELFGSDQRPNSLLVCK